MDNKSRYKKYKYIIWSQEEGFFSIDSISDDDLRSITFALNKEVTKRFGDDSRDKENKKPKKL
tara:strand:+ start:2616 stop:2804 length:189 start_codon:yes stop_codon:yes gene_type:complete